MSEITDLEQRLSSALDRIGRGVEAQRARLAATTTQGAAEAPARAQAATADTSAETLKADLEKAEGEIAELSTTNATLRRRLKKLTQAMERKLETLTEQNDARAIDLQRLRRANLQLVEANRALLTAQAEAGADPVAVNRGMMAELEALRAERRAEAHDLDAVMGELDRLVTEKPDA